MWGVVGERPGWEGLWATGVCPPFLVMRCGTFAGSVTLTMTDSTHGQFPLRVHVELSAPVFIWYWSPSEDSESPGDAAHSHVPSVPRAWHRTLYI